MAYEKNPDEFGALWLKTGGKGEYMTGEINGVKVFCTPIKSAHAKAPTWRVMKSKPREESVGKVGSGRPYSGDYTEYAPVTDDDIAF